LKRGTHCAKSDSLALADPVDDLLRRSRSRRDRILVLPKPREARGFQHDVLTSPDGFGIGPAAGRLAAELAIGATPSADPAPFRYSRFSDGSPISIGPEI